MPPTSDYNHQSPPWHGDLPIYVRALQSVVSVATSRLASPSHLSASSPPRFISPISPTPASCVLLPPSSQETPSPPFHQSSTAPSLSDQVTKTMLQSPSLQLLPSAGRPSFSCRYRSFAASNSSSPSPPRLDKRGLTPSPNLPHFHPQAPPLFLVIEIGDQRIVIEMKLMRSGDTQPNPGPTKTMGSVDVEHKVSKAAANKLK